LRALYETYRYQPMVLTTSPDDAPLNNGLPLCDVRSWMTGRRLVSLPFSDHCDPLFDSEDDAPGVLAQFAQWMSAEQIRHTEFRPLCTAELFRDSQAVTPDDSYMLHTLSLEPEPGQLLDAMHKSCIVRRIRRAERESLRYETGRSDLLFREFYRLLLRTARRHMLPPQPRVWFENLRRCLGDAFLIHVAYWKQRAVAAMITLDFKDTITYKYGCSDERMNHLGSNPFLFWKMIERGKQLGFRELDLGRTEPESLGLIAFKDRLGAERVMIHYYRIPAVNEPADLRKAWVNSVVRRSFGHFPDPLLIASGRILYRHFG
jgi:hypothetical protein